MSGRLAPPLTRVRRAAERLRDACGATNDGPKDLEDHVADVVWELGSLREHNVVLRRERDAMVRQRDGARGRADKLAQLVQIAVGIATEYKRIDAVTDWPDETADDARHLWQLCEGFLRSVPRLAPQPPRPVNAEADPKID